MKISRELADMMRHRQRNEPQVFCSDVKTRKIAYIGVLQVYYLTQSDFAYYCESYMQQFIEAAKE